MAVPLRIVFKGMDPSEAVTARIEERVAKLGRLFDRATKCRVTVEAPHRSQSTGKMFVVHLDITVPGEELAVSRSHRKDHAHEDVYLAIRDAFNAAGRRLQDHARRKRGDVKTHRPKPQASAATKRARRGAKSGARAGGRDSEN